MYKTGTILTPQKLRRQLSEMFFYEHDPAVGFHITDVATVNFAEGTNYDLYVANGKQTSLLNVLTAVNPEHTVPNKYVVPSTFFTATAFTDEATATAAFLAAFVGINMLAPPAQFRAKKIPIATHCEVEFFADADEYIAGEMLTCVWDATAEWIVPNRFKKTTDPTLAIAWVAETNPRLPITGDVTMIRAIIDRRSHLPLAEDLIA